MPQVIISKRAQADIFRLYKFLANNDELSAKRAVLAIKNAFNPLRKTPMIGRTLEEIVDLRELVIGVFRSGLKAFFMASTARRADCSSFFARNLYSLTMSVCARFEMITCGIEAWEREYLFESPPPTNQIHPA